MCISLCVILFYPASSLNKSCTGLWTQMQYLCIISKYHTGDPGSEGAGCRVGGTRAWGVFVFL